VLFLVGLSEEVAAQELTALIEHSRTQEVVAPAEREGLLRWAGHWTDGVDAGTVFQPDLVLVREENRSILQDVVRGVPDFVAEVLSPPTARRDKGVKLAAYARFGVRECWIVGDENQTVEAYRLEATGGTYRFAETCRPGPTAATPLSPGLALDVAALFAE
jgi:Uma2 family endonuclease